jgi:hypothetical protein
MNTEILFDPARMPERNDIGWVSHPDLDQPRWNKDEEHLDLKAFTEAGYDVHFELMDNDIPEGSPLFLSYWGDGDPDISDWEPSPPEGERWQLIGIWDSEDGPFAMFIRQHQEETNG